MKYLEKYTQEVARCVASGQCQATEQNPSMLTFRAWLAGTTTYVQELHFERGVGDKSTIPADSRRGCRGI